MQAFGRTVEASNILDVRTNGRKRRQTCTFVASSYRVTALGALGRFDPEHAAVYFHIVYTHLREPLKRAVEGLIMQHQTAVMNLYPPFIQELIDRRMRDGKLEGKLEAERNTLLRLSNRTGIALSDADRARIETCTDLATLERWIDNVISAKTVADVFG